MVPRSIPIVKAEVVHEGLKQWSRNIRTKPGLVASVGEASPSSVRARGERDPPGRLRVHRRAIDVDGAAPGGAGGAVRHGVDPSGRLLVRRSGSPGPDARVGAGGELPLHGMAQLSPRADGGTRRAPAGDGSAAVGGGLHATR